jgi:hypothetical protein
LGALKPATYGRFKSSHPSGVVVFVNSTIFNGRSLCFQPALFSRLGLVGLIRLEVFGMGLLGASF